MYNQWRKYDHLKCDGWKNNKERMKKDYLAK